VLTKIWGQLTTKGALDRAALPGTGARAPNLESSVVIVGDWRGIIIIIITVVDGNADNSPQEKQRRRRREVAGIAKDTFLRQQQ